MTTPVLQPLGFVQGSDFCLVWSCGTLYGVVAPCYQRGSTTSYNKRLNSQTALSCGCSSCQPIESPEIHLGVSQSSSLFFLCLLFFMKSKSECFFLCCCRIGPQVQWYSQSLAGTSMIPVVSSPDLLLVRYAPTLPICAVVINQLSTRDRCVLFVSPQHHYQVAANLKCLRDSPVSGRR